MLPPDCWSICFCTFAPIEYGATSRLSVLVSHHNLIARDQMRRVVCASHSYTTSLAWVVSRAHSQGCPLPPRCGACARDRLGLLVALQEAGCPRLSVLHGRCFDGRCRLRPIRPLAWARRNDRYRGSPLPVPSEHLSPQEGLSPWHRGCCRLCRAPSHCLPAHPLTVSRGSRGAPLAHLHGADVGCAHARVPDCFVSMIGSGGRFCCPFRCDAPF